MRNLVTLVRVSALVLVDAVHQGFFMQTIYRLRIYENKKPDTKVF
jgi:hypothetical protein